MGQNGEAATRGEKPGSEWPGSRATTASSPPSPTPSLQETVITADTKVSISRAVPGSQTVERKIINGGGGWGRSGILMLLKR